MAKTLAQILLGEDMEGGEVFCDTVYNNLKNHFRADYAGTPCVTLTEQLGMIISDAHDDHLYHVTTGPACIEIIQGDISITDNVAIVWGNTPVAGNSSIEYDETTNDAIIWGIPVAAERGVIICRMADIAVDFTGEVTASAQPVFWFIDADTDSYLGVGHQADDRPGIWSGPDDSKILAIQYEANADVTFFENSDATPENRLVYIYGWDVGAATTRYGTFQVTNSGSFELNAEEAGALAQGGTVVVRWYSDRVQWLDDKLAEWGSGNDASIEYDDGTNDAWIFGIPCAADKRGLVFCDKADIGADMTGVLPFRTLPTLSGIDADLDSYWELGWFGDDIGLLTVPANPLRENMITNSGFGVWSQSDTNKGLGTLVYDNLAGGNFGVGDTITGATSGAVGKLITDNGSTSMTLGAVSGTFQDNEQIGNGAGVTADVNGDNSIGITNDPMSNDSTGEWTDDGANIALAFVAAEYTVTTNAANQRAWMTACAFTAGKIYKIELDIKDGTQAGVDIELYFDDGAAQYGKVETTAAGWASIFFTFECITTTAVGLAGFRVVDNCGGNNIQIRRFSCYEITPCCTGDDNIGFDTWWKSNAGNAIDIYREHSNEETTTKRGSFYALKIVPIDSQVAVNFPALLLYNNEEWYKQFRGRTVTFGAWVLTNDASHARLNIYDSVAYSSSGWHTGGGTWEWLEVTRTINAATTHFYVDLYTDLVSDVDGSTIVYVSQPILVFGASIGEGNYRPRQQELIWLETFINGKKIHNLVNQSTTAWTDINTEADTDARLPKGCKALYLYSNVRDSASAANNCYLSLQGKFDHIYINRAWGITNSAYATKSGWADCNYSGDIKYSILASGAGTFSIQAFNYYAVQVN